jgi:hypothetical protein
MSLAMSGISKLGLRNFASPNSIEVQGKAFKHNSASAVANFIEDPTSNSTLITFGNASWHLGPGVGRLSTDIIDAIRNAGRGH